MFRFRIHLHFPLRGGVRDGGGDDSVHRSDDLLHHEQDCVPGRDHHPHHHRGHDGGGGGVRVHHHRRRHHQLHLLQAVYTSRQKRKLYQNRSFQLQELLQHQLYRGQFQ